MKDFTLTELRESIPCQIGENPVKFMLPSWYDSNGNKGGYIFNDSADALKHKELEIKRAEYKLELARQEEARKQKEIDDYNNLILSYGGFLSENPMKRGKQLKTMERLISNNGEILTRRALIQKRVKDGWKVESYAKPKYDDRGYSIKGTEKTSFILIKDDVFLELNVTEREYAEFLIDQKLIPE